MNPRPRLVTPADAPRDKLAEQKLAALAALATCAHAAEELERAASSYKGAAYIRARLHHLAVVLSSGVEGATADLGRAPND